jgi:hypothetical protein
VVKVVESIKLKNTDTDSQLGIRIATITYIDTVGNESASATVESCFFSILEFPTLVVATSH